MLNCRCYLITRVPEWNNRNSNRSLQFQCLRCFHSCDMEENTVDKKTTQFRFLILLYPILLGFAGLVALMGYASYFLLIIVPFTLVKYINPYIRISLFREGVKSYMTSYELIWRLIVILLLSNYNDDSQDTNKD